MNSALHALLAALLLAPPVLAQDAPERPTEPAQTEAEPEPDFVHPLGLSFDHAERWKVEETALGLSLLPPDLERMGLQPAELHAVTMIGADAKVKSLDDKRAGQLVTQLVQTQAPFLRPKGKAQQVEGRKEARRFDYRGTLPQGQTVECRVYGVLLDGWFVSLTTLAAPELCERREAALLEVVRSLKLGKPQADQELPGTWYSETFTSIGSVGDRLNTSTKFGVTLHDDGTVTSSTQTVVSGRDANGLTAPDPRAGRWARKGDQVWVVWRAGGAARWSVYVQGQRGRREMLLTAPDRRTKVLWTEYR